MKNDSFGIDEIHEIRRKIDEEMKDMTIDERVAYINQCGEAAAKKYGFKIIYPEKENDEMHEMRRKIYEETEKMTESEVVEYYTRLAEAASKKNDFKAVPVANEKLEAKLMSADADVIENAKT